MPIAVMRPFTGFNFQIAIVGLVTDGKLSMIKRGMYFFCDAFYDMLHVSFSRVILRPLNVPYFRKLFNKRILLPSCRLIKFLAVAMLYQIIAVILSWRKFTMHYNTIFSVSEPL